MIRVLIADDHAMVRAGLAQLLSSYADLEVVVPEPGFVLGAEMAHLAGRSLEQEVWRRRAGRTAGIDIDGAAGQGQDAIADAEDGHGASVLVLSIQ